jgi:hypothetical protein
MELARESLCCSNHCVKALHGIGAGVTVQQYKPLCKGHAWNRRGSHCAAVVKALHGIGAGVTVLQYKPLCKTWHGIGEAVTVLQ